MDERNDIMSVSRRYDSPAAMSELNGKIYTIKASSNSKSDRASEDVKVDCEGVQNFNLHPHRSSIEVDNGDDVPVPSNRNWWSWVDKKKARRNFSGDKSDRVFEERLTFNSNDKLIVEQREKVEARELVLVSPLPQLLEASNPNSSEFITPASDTDRVQSMARKMLGAEEDSSTWKSTVKEWCQYIGPGWMVAMAYIDPGNLEGDLGAGALRSDDDPRMGYRLLWVLLWATSGGFLLQRLAIKLGISTGKDLATVCRSEFPKWLSVCVWLFTELCLIGADIQAVVGSAVAMKLLFRIPFAVGVVVSLIDTFIVLLIDCLGVRKLEACFAALITIMAGCFLANMITSKPDVVAIAEGLGFVTIPKGSLPFTIGLIGSVIMPHNFFLQSAVVQSRSIDRTNEVQVNKVARVYTVETFFLLSVSFVINLAVVVAFANPKIKSPDGSPLDLYNAHLALSSAIGAHSQWIWAIGLLAAGQCSTMACTYTGQFVMEGLLGIRIERLWLRVVTTRCISIIPLLFIIILEKSTVEILATKVNIMQTYAFWSKKVFAFEVCSFFSKAFLLPFTLLLLLKFTSSSQVMGRYTLSLASKITAYIAGGLIIAINLSLIVSQYKESVVVWIALSVYLIMLGYLLFRPINHKYDVMPDLSHYTTPRTQSLIETSPQSTPNDRDISQHRSTL